MKIKFKYLLIISCVVVLGVALTAVSFSGQVVKTSHYQNGEISFDYPSAWQVMNGTNTSEIVAFNGTNGDYNVAVNREYLPAGYMKSNSLTFNPNEQGQFGFQFVSNKTLDLNGAKAQEDIYQVTANGTTQHRTEIWISKNNALYSFIITSNGNTMDDNNPEIQALTRNLTIEKTTVNNTGYWGEISLPSLNENWKIVPDTVNHYDSVYHVATSFYPGQNGTIGLMGHHTHFSAPFNDTYELKVGQPVIITDYLTQKKYIYKVTSNGDINWNYKTSPVQYPAGNYALTLVTCYPPGYMEGAYQTHLTLVSVQPI